MKSTPSKPAASTQSNARGPSSRTLTVSLHQLNKATKSMIEFGVRAAKISTPHSAKTGR
jgi:hypothetical protein